MSNIEVRLLSNMGSDLSIVQDARISFGNHETEWDSKAPGLIEYLATGLRTKERKALVARLLDADDPAEANALIDEIQAIQKHWSPFAHAVAKFYIKAPLAIARQLWKSHIGMASQDEVNAWNEVSRRYVDGGVEFFQPDWRSRGADVKQGSGAEMQGDERQWVDITTLDHHSASGDLYDALLHRGVSPEQARFELPQAMMTEWVWTGSLAAFARVVIQRSDPHAQKECKIVTDRFSEELSVLYPVAWRALVRNRQYAAVGNFW